MSQINHNVHYNMNQRYPNFKSESLPISAETHDLSNIEIPEMYQMPDENDGPKNFKEVVKKVDVFDAVSPWLEHPILTAGTTAATLYGIDKFTNAWSGEYEKSLLGKATKLGDDITNAKIFKKEPVKKVLDTVGKGYKRVSKAVNNNSMVKAMKETPCIPEWSFGKIETISQQRRIISDDFIKIADNLGLDNDNAISLKKLGLNKNEQDFLTKMFKVDKLSNVPEEKAVNAILMKRLGKSESEISRIAEMGKGGLNTVKQEIRNLIGLSVEDIKNIRLDETDKYVEKVFEAAKKGKGKIWVGEGEMPLLGKFQPLKRKIGFDSVYNRMHSLADGAKTSLGKGFSQVIQKIYRGFTFGGGKGGMIIFIVPNLVRMLVNTAKAEPEEKVSTAVQGSIGAISWVFTMPLATKMIYALGGLKYSGMGKDKVEQYRNLINNFNAKSVNLDKAAYKTQKKALEEQLKNLRKVDGQNLLTKMCRKIANVFTSDLGMIQPHKESISGQISKFFKNAGNVPVRFITAMLLIMGLDTIINKTLSAIFGRAHDESVEEAHKEDKKRQKKFTKEDLQNRMLQTQQKKVLGIDQPKTEEIEIPEYALSQEKAVTEKTEETTKAEEIEEIASQTIPGQEGRFRLPQETKAENITNVAPIAESELIQTPTEPEQLMPNYQPITAREIETPKDSYTYIPSSLPAAEVLKQNGSKVDTYTYIPSQENILNKNANTPVNKYIPSQVGASFTKTFDNSGLQNALRRADRAEQQAIEILNGKFKGI